MPAVLEVGYCLAGCNKSCTIECINTGGEGNFKLDQLDKSDQQLKETNLVTNYERGRVSHSVYNEVSLHSFVYILETFKAHAY